MDSDELISRIQEKDLEDFSNEFLTKILDLLDDEERLL